MMITISNTSKRTKKPKHVNICVARPLVPMIVCPAGMCTARSECVASDAVDLIDVRISMVLHYWIGPPTKWAWYQYHLPPFLNDMLSKRPVSQLKPHSKRAYFSLGSVRGPCGSLLRTTLMYRESALLGL